MPPQAEAGSVPALTPRVTNAKLCAALACTYQAPQDDAKAWRPKHIRSDNGPEFVARLSDPGSPGWASRHSSSSGAAPGRTDTQHTARPTP